MKKVFKSIFKFIITILIISSIGFLIYKYYPKITKLFLDKEKTKQVKVVKKKEKTKKEINLTLVGDIMYEGLYLDSINNGDDLNTYLSLVSDKYFKKDDLTIGNLETTITDNDKLEVSGYNYKFCTPQNIIDALNNASMDVVSTTNNHSADRGIDGINSTLDYLNNNTSITPVGSYKNIEDRDKPVIIEKNGIKIGFVAYSMGTNDFGKYVTTDEAWRLGLFRKLPYTSISDEYLEIMKKEISETRKECDVLIAIMHWGQEFQFNERDDQRQLAKFLNEQNVDIVLGSHSHCLQPVEWYTNNEGHKTLVFYSFGNFTSADEDVERGSNDIDNAYQIGLLSSINIELDEDNNIVFNSIKLEPTINYFNKDKKDFKIIPLSEYTEEYEQSHYRYNYGLNKTYINDLYNRIISEEFR